MAKAFEYNEDVLHDGMKWAKIRKMIDPFFGVKQANLSDAYYNYWSQGQSKPFKISNEVIARVNDQNRAFLVKYPTYKEKIYDNLNFQQFTYVSNLLERIRQAAMKKAHNYIKNNYPQLLDDEFEDELNRDIGKEEKLREAGILLKRWFDDEITNQQMLDLKAAYQSATKTVAEQIDEIENNMTEFD